MISKGPVSQPNHIYNFEIKIRSRDLHTFGFDVLRMAYLNGPAFTVNLPL